MPGQMHSLFELGRGSPLRRFPRRLKVTPAAATQALRMTACLAGAPPDSFSSDDRYCGKEKFIVI
jgi:hypothetical protein